MAETTLSKFGVPVNTVAGMLHPKQKYRFRVIFLNFGGSDATGLASDLTQNVMTMTRPKLGQEPIAIDAYNSKAYIASKHEWETVELKMRDDITGSVVGLVGEQVQRQINHYEQTSALSGADYKFSMEIQTMDGSTDGVLDFWRLEGCFVSNADYSDLDYASSDPVEISLTIRYDNATHQSDLGNPMSNSGGSPADNVTVL